MDEFYCQMEWNRKKEKRLMQWIKFYNSWKFFKSFARNRALSISEDLLPLYITDEIDRDILKKIKDIQEAETRASCR